MLDLPFTIYVACANDIYRKPRIGMWEEMSKDAGFPINMKNSYLVGDAAGRNKDHSDSDIHFCENLGIKFFTPEEFFLGDRGQISGHKFHPQWFLKFESESEYVQTDKFPTMTD
jgi:bifunctional polynucleotide phosphatase/kinase